MAGGFITESDLISKWGIEKAALDNLVEKGRLHLTEQDGEKGFSEEQVAEFEETDGGGEFVAYEEVLQDLQLNRSELKELVEGGKLTEYKFGGDPRYEVSELQGFAAAKMATGVGQPTGVPAGFGKEPTVLDYEEVQEAEAEGEEALESESLEALLGDEPEEEPVKVEEEGPVLEVEQVEEAGDEAFFDFSEELQTDVKEKAEEVEQPAEVEEVEDAEAFDSDMITEVLDVGEDEIVEEDLLGDIIEDVGGEIEVAVAFEEDATEEPGGDETVDVGDDGDLTGEPTADVTVDESVSDEVTAEITQLEEEAFEGEELEDILAGEEEVEAGEVEEDEFEVPYGEPVAAMEPPVPVWILVMLVVVVVVQVVGGLFTVGNALIPKSSPAWLKSLNPFAEAVSPTRDSGAP